MSEIAGQAGQATESRPTRKWLALDGMRAIAVLAVLGEHVGVLSGGYLGVDVFFVLSGFLITSLLITEWDARAGRIRFRDFYARRALRLFPALGCVVIAAALVSIPLQLAGDWQQRVFAHATLTAIPWVLLFSGNFVIVYHLDAAALGALSHTWSLAVEEQFYVLWPMLFIFLMRRRLSRRSLALLLGGTAVAEMTYRLVLAGLGTSYIRLYCGTDTRSDGLMMGCALAFWLAARTDKEGPGVPERQARLARLAIWLAAAALAGLFLTGQRPDTAIDVTAAVLATAVIVAGVVFGRTPPALDRLLRARWAVYVGRRSYGLYLWQVVLLGSTQAVLLPITGLYPAAGGPRLLFSTAIGLAATAAFVIADVSYRYVELPALRLKRRFSLQPRADTGHQDDQGLGHRRSAEQPVEVAELSLPARQEGRHHE